MVPPTPPPADGAAAPPPASSVSVSASVSATAPATAGELSPGGLRAALIKSATQFSVATVASVSSGMIRAFYVGSLLGPAAAGVWIGLQLVVTYGANAHLGAVYGMHRHVPLLRGRGDFEGAELVKRTTFTFSLLAGMVAFLLAASASVGLLAPLERLVPERAADLLLHLRAPEVRSVVLGVAVLLPINLLRAYYVTQFKAENRFREASIGSLLGSAVGVLSILLIPPYGLAGAVWGLLALVGVEAAYLAVRAGLPRLALRWPVLRAQLAVGVITVATSVVATTLGSIDRYVLIERFAAEARGHYWPATLASTLLGGLAAVPNSVLYPRLAERFGRTGRPADLVSLVDGPLRLVAAFFALLAGAAVIATPALLHLALPKYLPGALATQIAIPGLAAYVTVGVAVNVLVALNRQWLYLVVLGASAAASYGMTHAAVQLWPGIEAVALGSCAGLLLYVLLQIVTSWLAMERPLVEALGAVGRALGPLAWATTCAVAILVGLGRWWPRESLVAAALGELLLLVLMAPLGLLELRRLRGAR